MTALALILAIGATTRLTLLFTRDQFPPVLWFRVRVLGWFGDESWVWKLITCPWCISFWIGLPVTAICFRYVTEGCGVVKFIVCVIGGALIGSLTGGIIAEKVLH